MHLRSLLLSTVLCGSVVVTTFIMQPGPAQAAVALKPQGSWTVSKVEAKQPGAVPYCALTRRFANGSVLTFARNPRDEGSLAIDFPKGAFEIGKDLTIDLVAGSETRSFKTAPVTERSIIVRMGEDQKFHQALEKSGQLKVSVADKAFDFSMPDMASGAQDLSACLGQSIEPAAGDSPQMQAMPAPSVEEQKIEKQASAATAKKAPVSDARVASSTMPLQSAPPPDFSADNSDLQAVREENIRLRNALERERREFENRFQQTGENTSATAELAEKVRLLELENSALKIKSGKEGAQKTAGEKISSKDADAAVMQEMATLKQENARLKSSVEEQVQRIAMLEQSSAGKTAKTDDAMNAQIAALKDQIATLESDNATLKTAMGNKKDESVVASNLATLKQLKEAQAQLAATKDERDRLSAEIAGIKGADADNRIHLASDNWNLEQATQRFNEAEREIRRLGSAVEQERAKCVVEKKDLEYMLFDPKIATKEQIARLTTLEEDLARAQQELEKAGGNKAKSDALELKIKELESRIADMAQRNASYELQAKDFQVTQNKVRDLESKLADATQKIAASESRLKDADQKLASVSTGQAKDLDIAQTRVRDLEGRLVEETQKIATFEARINEANQKLASASAESERLRQSLTVSEQKQSASGDQKAMIDALRQEVSSLNAQIANMQSEKTAMAAQLSQIRPAAGGDASADVRAARSSIARADTVVSRADIEVSTIGSPTGQAQAMRPVATPVFENAPVPTITAATANIRLISAADVEALLRRAGVQTANGVQKLESSMGAGRVAYRWQTQGLFGTAEQKGMETPGQFDHMVREYLDNTKARCAGQFASVPAFDEGQGTKRVAAYEIACVDSTGGGASAALIFYSLDGKAFTTVAHEAVPESMDIAMDARDHIMAAVQGGKSAAR